MKTTILFIVALIGLTTTAEAHPADHTRAQRLDALTYELKEAARHSYRAARAQAHHRRSHREVQALAALRQLDQQAQRFHRRNRFNRSRAGHRQGEDFQMLWRSYLRAERSLHFMHARNHVYDDFRRVERIMNRLSLHYGGGFPNDSDDWYGPEDDYNTPVRDGRVGSRGRTRRQG